MTKNGQIHYDRYLLPGETGSQSKRRERKCQEIIWHQFFCWKLASTHRSIFRIFAHTVSCHTLIFHHQTQTRVHTHTHPETHLCVAQDEVADRQEKNKNNNKAAPYAKLGT